MGTRREPRLRRWLARLRGSTIDHGLAAYEGPLRGINAQEPQLRPLHREVDVEVADDEAL